MATAAISLISSTTTDNSLTINNIKREAKVEFNNQFIDENQNTLILNNRDVKGKYLIFTELLQSIWRSAVIKPYSYEEIKPRIEAEADLSKFHESVILEELDVIDNKYLQLKEDIGSKLFSQLSDKQKDFMIKTSGIINLNKKIDINKTYQYYEEQ